MGRDPTVLITGADGQVGRALRVLLPGARAPGHAELDVTDADAVAAALEGTDAVVHTAGLTNVDACETDRERAEQVNVGGTRNVVDAARRTGTRVIYLSTDYVFDGRSDRPYVESDHPAPLNVYGRTKLEAERLVASLEGSLIVRSSWIFGDGRNFVATILDAAASAARPLKVVDDQRGIPTPAAGLAWALRFAIEGTLDGILHVAGDGSVVSWAELARAALEAAGSQVAVDPVTTEEYMSLSDRPIVPRPRFSALDLSKARSLRVPLLDWRTGLKDYVGARA